MDGDIPLTGNSDGESLVTRSSCNINSRISTMHSYNTAYNTRTEDVSSKRNNHTLSSLPIPSQPPQSPTYLISIFLHRPPIPVAPLFYHPYFAPLSFLTLRPFAKASSKLSL